jgi:hypothetical protein
MKKLFFGFTVLILCVALFADDKTAFSQYEQLIQSPVVADRVKAVEGLAEVENKKKATSLLLNLLSVESKSEVQDAVYKVLAGYGKDDSAVEMIIKTLQKLESGDVRAQLMKVLWSFKRTDCDDVVLKGLEDPAWEVRLTVAETFGKSRLEDRSVEFRKRAIEQLIKVLPLETDGRTQTYIHGALIELTEKDFGTSQKEWKDWWAKNKQNYGQPKEEKKEGEKDEPQVPGKIKTEVVPPWKEDKEEVGKPKPRFFGEEISKKRVFFVIDVSGSMAEQSSSGQTKLEIVKKEMKNAIDAMDESYSFNMIFYNHGYVKWKDKLQKATKEIKAEAKAAIDRQQPAGMTNIWAVLKVALEDADTKLIIFLSDGLPTAGITDTKRILEDIKKWNKYKDIQINTVGMQGADSTFLSDLASQNKGSFKMAN